MDEEQLKRMMKVQLQRIVICMVGLVLLFLTLKG